MTETQTATDDSEFDGRIGESMTAAVEFVADNGGVVKSRHVVARHVFPRSVTQYGYPPVNRATKRGLLTVDRDHEDADPRGAGAVVLTERGRRFLGIESTPVEELSGVWDSKADALRDAGYDSVEAVEEASVEELSEICGIGIALASRIKASAETF